MKRALLQNVKVMPYESGAVLDRSGFLSAVLGAAVSAAGTLSIDALHCDTEDGTFEAVPDTWKYPNDPTGKVDAEADDAINLDIDLLGAKRYVRFDITGTATATYAIALGDSATQPV